MIKIKVQHKDGSQASLDAAVNLAAHAQLPVEAHASDYSGYILLYTVGGVEDIDIVRAIVNRWYAGYPSFLVELEVWYSSNMIYD